MKRIIFSSVCAVALFSVSANAAEIKLDLSKVDSFATANTELTTAIKSANTELSKLSTYVNWTNQKNTYDSAVQTTKDKETALTTKISERNTAGEALIGKASQQVPELAAAKNLTDIRAKLAEDAVTNAKKIAEVDTAISAISRGEKFTFTELTGLTAFDKADYETAVDNVGTANTELGNAKKAETAAKANLEIEKRALDAALAKDADAAKVFANWTNWNKEVENITKANDKIKEFNKLEVSIGDKNAAASDAEEASLYAKYNKALEVLGKEDDTITGASKYALVNKALDDVNKKLKEKTATEAKRDDAAKKLVGSAHPTGEFVSSAEASHQTTLENLKAFYDYAVKDHTKVTGVDSVEKAKVNAAAIAKAMKLVSENKALKDDTELLSAAEAKEIDSSASAAVKFSDVKGGITTEATNYDGFVTQITTINEALGKDTDAANASGKLYAKLNYAKDELKDAQTNRDTCLANIEKAQAKLKELEAQLVEAKANTLLGQIVIAKVDDKIGAKYSNIAKGEIKQLVGALIDNNTGALYTKEELAQFKVDVANALKVAEKDRTDAQKEDIEEYNKLMNTVNAVASAALKGDEDNVRANSQAALNIQINNMNKRLGEVRGLEGDTGLWFRTYGGRYSTDNDHFNYYSTQLGADRRINLSNGDIITGALLGFDKVNTEAKAKTYSIGGYVSYIDNSGFFADMVLKYGNTKYSQDGWSHKKQNLFLASLEGGYRIDLGTAYIEPSLELITGRIGKYEAKTNTGTTVSVDSYTPFVVKPQAYFGMNLDDLSFRIGGGYVYNTKKQSARMDINNLVIEGLNASATHELDKNNYGFASIGGSYKFTDNLRLNLGVERSFGGKLTQDYEINAVIRYTF